MIDQTLLNQIQYTMIEPPDGGQSWPSELWTRDEVLGYVNKRQNNFIKATHIKASTGSVPIAQGTTRYILPTDWIASLWVYWQASSGTRKALMRSDSWEMDHSMPLWDSGQGVPKVYMDRDVPTLTIQVAPIPAEPGILSLVYISAAADVNGNGVELEIADEFTPTVKYGVLADMFSKVGRAHDPVRAKYCQDRYQMGIEIAQSLLEGFKS